MQNGTLFADPIRASSPKSTASTGRTEAAPDQRQYVKFLLQCGSHPQDVRSSAVVAAQTSAAQVELSHLMTALNDRPLWAEKPSPAAPSLGRLSWVNLVLCRHPLGDKVAPIANFAANDREPGSEFVLCELRKQRLRLLHIRSAKPFGKPAVDRRQQFAGLGPPALLGPEAGQARRRPQFQ